MIPALVLAAGIAALVPLVALLRRRQREAEERAARTLARLHRRRATFAERHAEALHTLALSARRPPAQP